jgi:hypothetical protein
VTAPGRCSAKRPNSGGVEPATNRASRQAPGTTEPNSFADPTSGVGQPPIRPPRRDAAHALGVCARRPRQPRAPLGRFTFQSDCLTRTSRGQEVRPERVAAVCYELARPSRGEFAGWAPAVVGTGTGTSRAAECASATAGAAISTRRPRPRARSTAARHNRRLAHPGFALDDKHSGPGIDRAEEDLDGTQLIPAARHIGCRVAHDNRLSPKGEVISTRAWLSPGTTRRRPRVRRRALASASGHKSARPLA